MNDFKKKIIDILFESEDEGSSDSLEKQILDDIKIEGDSIKAPKASDILYGKQDKPSSFIDYFEVPRTVKKEDDYTKIECYELREHVSPIFGVINQKGKKKKNIDKDIDKAVNKVNESSKKHGDYLNVVISPIYGYDDDKANDVRQAFKDIGESKRVMSDEEIEEKYNQEPAFELPDEETLEAVNDSVLEAVEELNQGSYVVDKIEQEEIKNHNDDYDDEIKNSDDDIYFVDSRYDDDNLNETSMELSKEDIEEAFRKINADNFTSDVFKNKPKSKYDIKADNDDDNDLFDELMGDDE